MYLFMKKLFLAIAFLTLGMSTNAQSGMPNDVEMLGTWNVTESSGIFSGRLPIYHNQYRKPVAFTFTDNAPSVIKWEYAGPDYDYEQVPGYWITHSGDMFILNILLKTDYSTGGDGISLLKFCITGIGNNSMTLQTLSGDGTMTLAKEGSSGIRATRSDAPGGKAYRLNGTPATESDKGIVIQNGKKTVHK